MSEFKFDISYILSKENRKKNSHLHYLNNYSVDDYDNDQ